MTNQTQGAGSSSPAELPTKRKRGRPRKDETLVPGENSNITAAAASDSAKKIRPSMGTINAPTNDMVGQVVSGVIAGSFDAGYLLNVKVADTDTLLRGLVFVPGQFTPITAANDVAPNVKMYQRKEIPFPSSNPQSQLQSASLSSEKSDGKPVEGQVQPTDENQSAAVTVPPVDISPINNATLSLGEVASEQKSVESAMMDKAVMHDLVPESFGSDLSLGEKALEQKTVESLQEKDNVFGEDQAPEGFGSDLSLGEKILEQKTLESALDKDMVFGEDLAPRGFGSDLSLGEKILEQKTVRAVLEKDMVFGEDQTPGGFGADFSLGEKISEQKTVESALQKDMVLGEDQAPGRFGNGLTLEPKSVESVMEKDGAAEKDQVMTVSDTGFSLGENVSEQKTAESELTKDEALGQDQVMQEYDAGLSLGEKISEQETLESSMEKGVIIEQNQMPQEFGIFKLEKEPNSNVELPEEIRLPSIPYNEILQGSETSNQIQVEHQTLNSDNAKASVFELNQFPAFTEPATGLDMLMEKYASPKQDDLQGTETGTTYSAPMSSIELNLFGAQHVPSEAKLAANDSERMVEPQPFSSPIDVNNSSMHGV